MISSAIQATSGHQFYGRLLKLCFEKLLKPKHRFVASSAVRPPVTQPGQPDRQGRQQPRQAGGPTKGTSPASRRQPHQSFEGRPKTASPGQKSRQHSGQQSDDRGRPNDQRASRAAESAVPTKRTPTSELACDHFHFCSGCTVENALGRPPLVARARAFFQSLHLQEPLALDVGPVHGWRCRAKLAVQSNPHGRPEIGLYKKDSHEVVPIPRCRIHHPRINQAVELIKQMARQLSTPLVDHSGQPSAKAGGRGLRYVQLTAAARGGKAGLRAEDDPLAQIQVVLVWGAENDSDPSFAHCQALCQALCAYGGISSRGSSSSSSPPSSLLHSVWVNFNPGDDGNAILSRKWRQMAGPTQLWQQFGQAQVCLAPGSFVQANYGAMQAAIQYILSTIPTNARLVELHAGVGVIGLAAASTGRLSHLRCIEVNGECAEPFEASRKALNAAVPVEFVVAAAGSSAAAFIADADVLVMDPPRKGLEAELLAELTKDKSGASSDPPGPHTLVYLSCGYDALERDLAALLASQRWRLDSARALLFFPGTNSLETLVVLRSSAPRSGPSSTSSSSGSDEVRALLASGAAAVVL